MCSLDTVFGTSPGNAAPDEVSQHSVRSENETRGVLLRGRGGIMKDVCRPAPFRYCHTGREEAALPQFVTPPVFVCLWLNVALLLSAAACLWMRRTPVYASGPAVVENCETSARNTRGTRV